MEQKKIIRKMTGLLEIQRIKLDMKAESDKKFMVKPIPKIVVEDTTKVR